MKKTMFCIGLLAILVTRMNAQSTGHSSYDGLFSIHCYDKHEDFYGYDFQIKYRLPKAFQLVLDNDLDGLKVLPKKFLQKNVKIRGVEYSLLTFSCKHNRKEIIYFLISNGADISFRNSHGELPLSFLVFSGGTDTNLMAKLIDPKTFIKKDKMGYSPLMYSVLANDNIIFDYLLKEYSKRGNLYDTKEIKYAFCFANDNLHIKNITSNYFDLNQPFLKNKSLIYGIEYPIDEIILEAYFYNSKKRLFLSPTQDKPTDDSLDLKLFQSLVKKGLDVNKKFQNNNSILFKINENIVLLKYLFNKIDNVNSINDRGETFLQFYIDSLITPKTMVLNNKPVFMTEKDRDYSEDLEMIKYFIDNNAIVNTAYKNGWYYLIVHGIEKDNLYIINNLFKLFPKSIDCSKIVIDLQNNVDVETLSKIEKLIKNIAY